MLFRLWFLYATKLALLGSILIAAGMFVSIPDPINMWICYAGIGICVPLCFAGVLLGLTLALQNFEMSCPICSHRGRITPYGDTAERGAAFRSGLPQGQIAVDCKNCGYVHAKNMWLSFKLLINENNPEDDG